MDLPTPSNEEPTKKKCKKLVVNTNKEQILLGLLQLSTVNNLPRSFLEMIGFKTLIGPLCKATRITFNRKVVGGFVDNSTCAARKLIAAELKQQPLITIEVDGASRGSRHFIGINARIVVDRKVIVRNLGTFLHRITDIL